MEQHAARRIDAQPGEQLRIAQRQFDHLAKLVDRFLQPADIVIGDIRPAMLGRFLIFRPQLDLGLFVDMDNALGHGRHHVEPYLGQGKGRGRQHLAQLRRHVAAIDLLLAMGGDKITRLQRPSHEAALQTAAIALQPQILLGRCKNHFLGRSGFDLADFDKIAGTRTGIGALQPVEPDKVQPLVFRIGQNRARGRCLFAQNLDDIALDQSQFCEIVARQPRKAAPAVFRPGVGHLQLQPLAFVFFIIFWLRRIGHRDVSPQYRFGCFQQDRDGCGDIRP